MATKNLIPRGSGEGGIGIPNTVWGHGYYETGNFNKGLFVSGKNIDEIIADAVTGGGLGGLWNAGAGGVIYYNGGNVGIGTTSPVTALEINRGTDESSPIITLSRGGVAKSRFAVAKETSSILAGSITDDLCIRTEGGNIRLGTAAATKTDMSILSNGNVGIGITNPNGKLVVQGDNADIFLRDDTGTDSASLLQDANGYGKISVMNNVGNPICHFDSIGNSFIKSGNVGIGTTIPSHKLTVDGDLRIKAGDGTTDHMTILSGTFLATSGNNSINGTNGSQFQKELIVGDLVYIKTIQYTVTAIASDILMTVFPPAQNDEPGGNGYRITKRELIFADDRTANVGIGTTNPESPLMIQSNPANDSMLKMVDVRDYVLEDHRADISLQGMDSDGTRTALAGIAAYASNDRRGGLILSARSDANAVIPVMVLSHEGNVGIGNASPTAQLSTFRENSGTDSGQQDSAFASIEVATKNTSANPNLKTGWLTQIGCYSTMGAGGSGISKNAVIAVYKHDSTSNEAAILRLSRSAHNSEQYFWVDNTGLLRTSIGSADTGSNTAGTVVGTQTSDERIKNIEDSFEYGLNDVLKLKPIAFNLKEQKDGPRKLGFGAQSTRPIIPESVFDSKECIDGYDPDPEDDSGTRQIAKSDQTKLGMEYTQLIPVLTKAIQEQQSIIEDLKSRIETLENK